MITFDENGFVKPYGPILTNLVTLEEVFVLGFPNSSTRRGHFERYREYNTRLLELLPDGFTQWVDGSFVSRKLNPNDIDLVTFVDADLYQQHEQEFDQLRRERELVRGPVDGYFVRFYPEHHPLRVRYEYDRVYWRNTFGTWKDRNQKTRDKGLLTLTF